MQKARILSLLSFLVFWSAFTIPSLAQPHEIGLFLGGASYYGDVGKDKMHVPENTCGGIFFRYNFNRHFSLRGNLLHGNIEGADSLSDLPFRYNRNLSFHSEIYESSIWLEFNFLPHIIGKRGLHSFYVFAGIGGFLFNPKAELNGNWYELQPLSTEGQGTSQRPGTEPYSLFSMNIPFGVGYKVNIGRSVCIGLETGFRRTYTDYLDDVSTTYVDRFVLASEKGIVAALLSDRSLSGGDNVNVQRGERTNNDWYVFTGITVSIKVFDRPEACHKFDP